MNIALFRYVLVTWVKLRLIKPHSGDFAALIEVYPVAMKLPRSIPIGVKCQVFLRTKSGRSRAVQFETARCSSAGRKSSTSKEENIITVWTVWYGGEQ